MNEMNLTQKNVLSILDQFEAFKFYLKPFLDQMELKPRKSISNPFEVKKQKTPSFNVFQSESSNLWLFNDYKTGDKGDIFQLVIKLKGCDFQQALEIINQDFALGLGMPQIKAEQSERGFSIKMRNNLTRYELAYWNKYGISQNILDRFHVRSVESFKRFNSEGKGYAIKASQGDPIFAYEILDEICFKIYRPLSKEKKYKFSWLGVKPADFYFGYIQLPGTGNQVFITGGEKDVISLANKGHAAISCNSETAIPSKEIISELKRRFKEILVLYDIDETGMLQSEQLCKAYGLSRILLPEEIKEFNGKDISDFFSQGKVLNDSEVKREDFEPEKIINDMSSSALDKLLYRQSKLRELKSKPIEFSSPILAKEEQAIIYPNTINVLQGKAGVHKSRLAETVCSAMLKNSTCNNPLLDFRADISQPSTVCYVDTERNLKQQLPYDLQQIQLKAGYELKDQPTSFDFVSLLEIPRSERFKALTEYLEHVRTEYDNHIFIVLDVVTDCIRDFNRPEDSMQLIDLMNEAINKYNVTFLCLIHENPGSADKARGHLGTEIMNKASTVIQVSFEKAKNNEPTDLICVNYLKCRNTKKHEPFYLLFDDVEKKLIHADDEIISDVMQSRKQKANVRDLADKLAKLLVEPKTQNDLVNEFILEFNCSDRVIRDRLKTIIEDKLEIVNQKGQACYLDKKRNSREVVYSLTTSKNQP